MVNTKKHFGPLLLLALVIGLATTSETWSKAPSTQGRITANSVGQSTGPVAAAASQCSQPQGLNTDVEMPFAVTSSAKGARNILCDLDFRCEDANNPGFFFFAQQRVHAFHG